MNLYAPHAAWEDTELFPVYREQFTETEFDKLSDRFEEREHRLLGSGGFEGPSRKSGTSERRWVITTSPSSRRGG
jgi:hypothetical protein